MCIYIHTHMHVVFVCYSATVCVYVEIGRHACTPVSEHPGSQEGDTDIWFCEVPSAQAAQAGSCDLCLPFCTYTYIYTHMNTHVNVQIRVYIYMYRYMCTHIYIYTHRSVSVLERQEGIRIGCLLLYWLEAGLAISSFVLGVSCVHGWPRAAGGGS